MTLCLHKGAEVVNYDQLRTAPLPVATASHLPLAHHSLVDMVKYALGYYGHTIEDEQFGITPDGMRFFGILILKSDYGNYTDTVGLRNSNDKSFPIGVSFGSKTFVCDNLAFIGDHVIKKKHTPNALRLLPGLLAEIVEPLHEQRKRQQLTFERYQQTPLSIDQADHLTIELYRRGVIGVQKIADVIDQFERPSHDWGDPTAYRFFNAATFALTGKIAEAPHLTKTLHEIVDSTCEVID